MDPTCYWNPKSGRPNELVFIPKKVADKLKEYIRNFNSIQYQISISCVSLK
jgi:hypothetical protein